MKKEISPVMLLGAIVALVVVIGIFGYRMLQPAPYEPSPGAGGKPGLSRSSPAPMTDSSGRQMMPPQSSPGPK